jgi:hypothetical protein
MEMSQKLGWEHTFGIPRGLRFETCPNLNIRGFRFETYPNLDIFVKHVPRDHPLKFLFTHKPPMRDFKRLAQESGHIWSWDSISTRI